MKESIQSFLTSFLSYPRLSASSAAGFLLIRVIRVHLWLRGSECGGQVCGVHGAGSAERRSLPPACISDIS